MHYSSLFTRVSWDFSQCIALAVWRQSLYHHIPMLLYMPYVNTMCSLLFPFRPLQSWMTLRPIKIIGQREYNIWTLMLTSPSVWKKKSSRSFRCVPCVALIKHIWGIFVPLMFSVRLGLFAVVPKCHVNENCSGWSITRSVKNYICMPPFKLYILKTNMGIFRWTFQIIRLRLTLLSKFSLISIIILFLMIIIKILLIC